MGLCRFGRSMLQYLIQVIFTLFPALTVLGTLYGFFNREESRKYKRGFVWGFFVSLVFSVVAAILRLNTNVFVREYYNFFFLVTAFVAEVALVFSVGFRAKNTVSPLKDRWTGFITTVIVLACLSYALPDLFLYPFEFAVGLDSIFHAEVLFKVIGYSLAIILSLAGGLCVSRVLEKASDSLARKTFAFVLLFFAAEYFVLFFQILMLRSRLMQNEILVNLLLFLLEYQNGLVYALLLAVILSCLGNIVSNKRAVFTGENPAVLRKKRAGSKRRVGWSAFCVLFVITAFVIMTVGVWMNNRTVELSPPVELAVSDNKIEIPLESVNDGHLHRFSYTTEDGTQVRYIVIRKSESAYGVALDACDICGASGYYERNGQIVCILCDVVMNIGTIGMPGGCNPVPLDHEITGGRIVIDAANLDAEAYRFE